MHIFTSQETDFSGHILSLFNMKMALYKENLNIYFWESFEISLPSSTDLFNS